MPVAVELDHLAEDVGEALVEGTRLVAVNESGGVLGNPVRHLVPGDVERGKWAVVAPIAVAVGHAAPVPEGIDVALVVVHVAEQLTARIVIGIAAVGGGEVVVGLLGAEVGLHGRAVAVEGQAVIGHVAGPAVVGAVAHRVGLHAAAAYALAEAVATAGIVDRDLHRAVVVAHGAHRFIGVVDARVLEQHAPIERTHVHPGPVQRFGGVHVEFVGELGVLTLGVGVDYEFALGPGVTGGGGLAEPHGLLEVECRQREIHGRVGGEVRRRREVVGGFGESPADGLEATVTRRVGGVSEAVDGDAPEGLLVGDVLHAQLVGAGGAAAKVHLGVGIDVGCDKVGRGRQGLGPGGEVEESGGGLDLRRALLGKGRGESEREAAEGSDDAVEITREGSVLHIGESVTVGA